MLEDKISPMTGGRSPSFCFSLFSSLPSASFTLTCQPLSSTFSHSISLILPHSHWFSVSVSSINSVSLQHQTLLILPSVFSQTQPLLCFHSFSWAHCCHDCYSTEGCTTCNRVFLVSAVCAVSGWGCCLSLSDNQYVTVCKLQCVRVSWTSLWLNYYCHISRIQSPHMHVKVKEHTHKHTASQGSWQSSSEQWLIATVWRIRADSEGPRMILRHLTRPRKHWLLFWFLFEHYFDLIFQTTQATLL